MEMVMSGIVHSSGAFLLQNPHSMSENSLSPESSAVVDVCAEQHQDHAGRPVAEPAAAEL